MDVAADADAVAARANDMSPPPRTAPPPTPTTTARRVAFGRAVVEV
jgi:hypothetical protein